jgi:hypothetical protein
MQCFECGDEGHIARECPNLGIVGADGKPPWCGSCDEITRLVDLGDTLMRCRQCHPLRGRMLAQDRRCPRCHEIVYVWDQAACGSHQAVGVHRDYVGTVPARPARSETGLRALARQQLAEARAAHADLDAWFTAGQPHP